MTKTKLKKGAQLNVSAELSEVWETLAEISVAVEDELEPTVEELEVAMEQAQQDIVRLEALVGNLQAQIVRSSGYVSFTTTSQAAPSYGASCDCSAKKPWWKRWLGR